MDVHIGAVALKALVFKGLYESWFKWSLGFPLDPDALTLRIKKNFVPIRPRIPDRDVISQGFFKPQGKPPLPKFKTGTIDLVLVMSDLLFDEAIDNKVAVEQSKRAKRVSNHALIPSNYSIKSRFGLHLRNMTGVRPLRKAAGRRCRRPPK